MHDFRTRIARHFALAALATTAAAAPAVADVNYQQVYFPVPANSDGLYINVQSLQTGSQGKSVAGWDINPYSATSLSWFNATGAGMMRYPGVTTGSAGSLDLGNVVDSTGSFGGGAVVVGSAPGNWRLNSYHYFGFKFIADDGLTRYGWGSFWIGSTIDSPRMIYELAWETTPGAGIAVGDGRVVSNDDRESATAIPLSGSLVQADTWLASPSADPLPGPEDCERLEWCSPEPDVWFRIEPNTEPGLLELDLCPSSFYTGVIVYRLDTATNELEMVASDRTSCTVNPYIEYCFLSADDRPTLIRVVAGGTISMSWNWTPITGPVFLDGTLWIGGATFSDEGTDSAFNAFPVDPLSADASGGTGSGLAGSSGSLSARIVTDDTVVQKITMQGAISGQQPPDYFADSNFRITTIPTIGDEPEDPIVFVVPSDSYFRVTATGVAPVLTARTGCVCGDRLTSGTYQLSVQGFGVFLDSSETYASSVMDWTLELSPTPFDVPGDIDGDGRVDANDLGILLASWGGTGAADVDHDGTVGAGDLAVVLTAWTG
jgi:hypothetical protein